MCRAKHDTKGGAGRRCNCKNPEHARALANTNRRFSRAFRRDFARAAGKYAGNDKGNTAKILMSTTPRELAGVYMYMSERDPEFAATIEEANLGGKFPGTHNMVVPLLRDPTSPTDRGESGIMKAHQGNKLLKTLAEVEASVYLDKQEGYLDKVVKSGAEPDRITAFNNIDERMRADNAGIYGMNGDTRAITSEQAKYLKDLTPAGLEAISSPLEVMQKKALSDVYSDARISATVRENKLTDREGLLSPHELMDINDDKESIEVRAGVFLERSPIDDSLVFRVENGKDAKGNPANIILPARKSRLDKQTRLIPEVEDVGFNSAKTSSPMGQASIYEQLTSPVSPVGKEVHRSVTEAAIRQTFESASVDPGYDSGKYSEIQLAGKRSSASISSLQKTGLKKLGEYGSEPKINMLSNELSDYTDAAHSVMTKRDVNRGLPRGERLLTFSDPNRTREIYGKPQRVVDSEGRAVDTKGIVFVDREATRNRSNKTRKFVADRKNGMRTLDTVYGGDIPSTTSAQEIVEHGNNGMHNHAIKEALKFDSTFDIDAANRGIDGRYVVQNSARPGFERSKDVTGNFSTKRDRAALSTTYRAMVSTQASRATLTKMGMSDDVVLTTKMRKELSPEAAASLTKGTGVLFNKFERTSSTVKENKKPRTYGSYGNKQVDFVVSSANGAVVNDDVVFMPGSNFAVLNSVEDDKGNMTVHLVDESMLIK